MHKKIRIGVFGAGRGRSMMHYCEEADNAILVAVCDASEYMLDKAKKELDDKNIAYYSAFDEFIDHDMDAVVLANFATEHAEYAIKCLNKNLHVLSEVLPCQTLAEAVRLVEATEKSDKIYAYGENYCYMPTPQELRRLIKTGKLGDFEYGEGEYMHNCEDIWDRCTHGDKNHWRNNMYATFYCTHSIGPLIHISGLRPISVTGFELPFNERMKRMGAKAGFAAVEMITLENGSIIKSLHGVGCSKNSIWYSVYGSDGRAESAREDAENGGVSRIYLNNGDGVKTYLPQDENSTNADDFGHGGSDFYTMYNFIEKICGNTEADVIDIYEALDMFLPGLLAYRSILNGGKPESIPDFRDKATRDKYRNDNACTSPSVAGEALIPSYSKGNPDIPDEIYDTLKKRWDDQITPKKKKLKMVIFPKHKKIPPLPDGYKIRNYADTNDIMSWVEVCKNGLLSDNAGAEAFEKDIIKPEGIDPFTDLFFIENGDGKIVATITAVNNFQNTNLGNIHMVSVAAEERGKGLGHVLCAIAERKLHANGVKMATLVTDDWRKAACKSYLKAGFFPVNYDDDMKERWSALLTEFKIDSVMMVKENGEPDQTIFRS